MSFIRSKDALHPHPCISFLVPKGNLIFLLPSSYCEIAAKKPQNKKKEQVGAMFCVCGQL